MNFEHFISYRYLTVKKGRFLSFLNIVSVGGIAIGVMALIVVTGVMTGFGNNLREKIIGTAPHIMIEKENGIRDFAGLQEKLTAVPGVISSSPYIQGNIFLENAGRAMNLVVRGVSARGEHNITKVDQYMVEGNFEDLAGNKVIIGNEMARYFGYELGDEITLISPGSGMAGQGWRYKLVVAGIFNTGMVDYDMNLVLVDLKQAQSIFNLAENVSTGIGVSLKDPYQAAQAKQKIYDLIGYSFLVRNWIDINRNLFDALFLEKWGLFIILTLMVLVASFNIISTLIVTVMSKVHDIGILQSIGVNRNSIRRIFIKQGFLIGAVGTFWGVVSGVAISYILRTFIEVPKQIYAIDRVPVDLQPFDMAMIIGAALLISYLATIYPASKAAALQPVEALRYE